MDSFESNDTLPLSTLPDLYNRVWLAPSGEPEGPIRRAIRELQEDDPVRAREILTKCKNLDAIRALHYDNDVPYCNISVDMVQNFRKESYESKTNTPQPNRRGSRSGVRVVPDKPGRQGSERILPPNSVPVRPQEYNRTQCVFPSLERNK